jgi:hypothetical protein
LAEDCAVKQAGAAKVGDHSQEGGSKAMEPHRKVRPDPDVVTTELEGKEAVLLHLGRKTYFTLNETGLRIWKMLGDGRTIAEVSEGLHGEFDVPLEKATQSVLNLVGELVSEKLAKVLDD